MKESYSISWQVGWSNAAEEKPSRMVEAAVPGAVQLDWSRAEGWSDPYYGENWRQFEWMEDKYWTYRAVLDFPAVTKEQRLLFVSKGIDYHFSLILDGVLLLRQEGMFTPVRLDITDACRQGSVLEIVIDPAPKREGAPRSRSQADHSCKPAVGYGWDWHPRLIPLGIWDDTYLEIAPRMGFEACETLYTLDGPLESAEVRLEAVLGNAAVGMGRLEWTILDPAGYPVHHSSCEITEETVTLTGKLEHPQLWWPHDQGPQPLYLSEARFFPKSNNEASDCCVQRIGFRRARLVMHEGAWKEPSTFPKSRSLPPVTMEINGRRIFCKGTNWVHPDIFPGRINEDHYRLLLGMAKEANMNILRVWGGGIVNKESFFAHCDELGLMVWQEFPLACNLYPDSPAYLKVLNQESASIIRKVRRHPSLVLWCGGNELFNAWSQMTEQSLPLRLLNRICLELDPDTPFIMTSPLEGMGHGHYMFVYEETGEDVFQGMIRAENTAYTEFGIPAPAPVEVLKSFMPPEEWFPPRLGTSWESHHGLRAGNENMWLMADQLEYYFGQSQALEELVERGQLLQSAGYKSIYEEARRQKPKCSMALNWCYNEPWPAAANNSIVSWPAIPKPAYYAIQAACRPVLASARVPKFAWLEGEWLEGELWMLNDSFQAVPGGRMEVSLLISGERHLLLMWEFGELPPQKNRRGPTARFLLPPEPKQLMKLELTVQNLPACNSEYTLLHRGSAAEEPNKPGQLLNQETGSPS